MTDKERLEMIKHDFEERGQYGGFIDDYDTLWLIEKVERYEKAFKEGWNARVNDGGKLPNSSNDDERSY